MARRFASLVWVALLLCAPELPAVEPSLDHAEEAGRPSLLLSFVGDIMHHEENAAMPDYDRLYDSVRHPLQVDDLTFANIEFPVDPSREPAGYPAFNGTAAYLEAAIRGGVDVLALANNHSFDMGRAGVTSTQEVVAEMRLSAAVHENGLRAVPRQPIGPNRLYPGNAPWKGTDRALPDRPKGPAPQRLFLF